MTATKDFEILRSFHGDAFDTMLRVFRSVHGDDVFLRLMQPHTEAVKARAIELLGARGDA